MPSSTSSSRDLRGAAGLTVLASALLFAAALTVLHCTTTVIRSFVPEPFGMGRLQKGLEALPEIASQPGRTAVVFGSSLVIFGFSPEVFDARLREHGHEITSFNLGFGNLNPSLQRILARRIRTAFESRGRKVDLLLIEFNPFQTTTTRRKGDAVKHEQFLALLLPARELLAVARNSPERGARFLATRYLRGGIAPEAVTATFGVAASGLAALVPSTNGKPELPAVEQAQIDEREALLFAALPEIWRIYGGLPPMWDRQRRGGLQLDFPETRPALEAAMTWTPSELARDLAMRERCCDILDLHFDEGLVTDFIALIHELSAVAKRTEVILLPKNHEWVRNSPEALERQRQVVARIERETGVPVTSFQDVAGFVASTFFDTTHLTLHEGKPAFSRHLADHYGPEL